MLKFQLICVSERRPLLVNQGLNRDYSGKQFKRNVPRYERSVAPILAHVNWLEGITLRTIKRIFFISSCAISRMVARSYTKINIKQCGNNDGRALWRRKLGVQNLISRLNRCIHEFNTQTICMCNRMEHFLLLVLKKKLYWSQIDTTWPLLDHTHNCQFH